MLESLWINMGIATILTVIKNPEKRIKLRATFLKLFLAIKSAYAGDSDFS